MKWRGWVLAFAVLILIAWLMVNQGILMQGHCIDLDRVPPC